LENIIPLNDIGIIRLKVVSPLLLILKPSKPLILGEIVEKKKKNSPFCRFRALESEVRFYRGGRI